MVKKSSGLVPDGAFLTAFAAEYTRRLFHPITIVAILSCSFLFAFIGPYDTYATKAFWFRLPFWTGIVVSSTMIALFFGVWASLRFAHRPFWFQSLVGGVIFSLVYLQFLWVVLNTFFTPDSIPSLLELYVVIVAISALVYGCMWCFNIMLEDRAAELAGAQHPSTTPVAQKPSPAPNDASHASFGQEFREKLFDPVNIALCFLGALLFAYIGPFGTYPADGFLFRLFFWTLLVWSTSIVVFLFAVWANSRFASQPFWFQSATGGTAFSVLYLILIWITLRAVYPASSSPEHVDFFVTTLAITTLLYVIMWFFAYTIETRIGDHNTPEPATTSTQQPAPKTEQISKPELSAEETCAIAEFLGQLGPNSGNRLIRLAMSDHYIEAHTDTGMHLLYMRFADAVKSLSRAKGAQVHRSHWVNLDEVATTQKDGSNIAFLMSDGSTVPISRSRKKELQNRGLI